MRSVRSLETLAAAQSLGSPGPLRPKSSGKDKPVWKICSGTNIEGTYAREFHDRMSKIC